MRKMKCQFAIKYKVTKVNDDQYIFAPISLLKGEEKEDGFLCDNGKEYPMFYDTINSRQKYYVDMIYSDDELSLIFDYDGDDVDFIGEYFFNSYKDTIMFVDTTDVNDAGIPYRNMINLKVIKEDEDSSIYYMDNSIPNVVLNEKAVREIMDAKTLKKAKLILTKYQKGLDAIKKCRDKNGVTRVSITGNKVNYYETSMNIDFNSIEESWEEEKSNKIIPVSSSHEISYQGLREYLKERIFGHDEEIDTFAQKLYMNHTAEEGETVESILFVGPTGTGKTATVRSACEYLGIPMSEANASNLVTQGIVGTSIEDVISALCERAGFDLNVAQRGLIFLDEFDKLSETTLETKTPIKHILLTFTAGGTFPINNGNRSFVFNSAMTNKVYAGVFERVTDKVNPMGFGAAKKVSPLASSDEELRKKIIDKKYFTSEELTRISTILPYNDLSIADKKDALLHSKLSEYANKRERYKRQFGIDLILEDDYIDAVIDKLSNTTGMRSIYNYVKKNLNIAERAILENEDKEYKKLVLTKDAVLDPKNFDLSK